MPNFKVFHFQTPRGTYPVKEFMEAQEKTTFMKIFRSIEFLETGGPFLKPPYAKKIDKNLYELRVRGKDAVRILYTKIGDTFYLLHAFKKKTQKIPEKELKTAIDRMKQLI